MQNKGECFCPRDLPEWWTIHNRLNNKDRTQNSVTLYEYSIGLLNEFSSDIVKKMLIKNSLYPKLALFMSYLGLVEIHHDQWFALLSESEILKSLLGATMIQIPTWIIFQSSATGSKLQLKWEKCWKTVLSWCCAFLQHPWAQQQNILFLSRWTHFCCYQGFFFLP